jgi:hypothetical protein
MAYHRQIIPDCSEQFTGGAARQMRRVYRGGVYDLHGDGFFSDTLRSILPLITKNLLPKLGKALFHTGGEIMSDVRQGVPFKEATKRGLKRSLERGRDAAIKKLSGTGGCPYKKPQAHKSKSKRRVRSH